MYIYKHACFILSYLSGMGVIIAASAKTFSYFKLVQGLIVTQPVQRFTVYFQDLITYGRSGSINSSGSHTKRCQQLAMFASP